MFTLNGSACYAVIPSSTVDFLISFILDVSVMITEIVVSQTFNDTVSNVLQINVLLLAAREGMWFMRDCASLHFSLTVREFWNNKYPRCE
jgi:hypothetical protein